MDDRTARNVAAILAWQEPRRDVEYRPSHGLVAFRPFKDVRRRDVREYLIRRAHAAQPRAALVGSSSTSAPPRRRRPTSTRSSSRGDPPDEPDPPLGGHPTTRRCPLRQASAYVTNRCRSSSSFKSQATHTARSCSSRTAPQPGQRTSGASIGRAASSLMSRKRGRGSGR